MYQTTEQLDRDIRKRTMAEARYIVAKQSTIRETASHFEISKSTVHKDLSERLPRISKFYYFLVRKVLDKNSREKSYRGGNATHLKYLMRKAGRLS